MSEEVKAVTGHCYCNRITYTYDFTTEHKTLFAAWCHCDSCRRVHSAPLYHVVWNEGLFPDNCAFTITKGSEFLKTCPPNANPGATGGRAFCTECGTIITGHFLPGEHKFFPNGAVAVYPNTLDEQYQGDNLPKPFVPTFHANSSEHVIPIFDDGLPRQ